MKMTEKLRSWPDESTVQDIPEDTRITAIGQEISKQASQASSSFEMYTVIVIHTF